MKPLAFPGSAALFVVQDGKTVLDWGRIQEKFWVHSIRKSFLSALVGIAINEQKLQLETPLRDFSFIPFELDNYESLATLQNLIASRSGIYIPAAAADREMPPRGIHKPGESWFYNNWDFNVIQLILEQTYNSDIFSLFSLKVAKPLGMVNFNPKKDGMYVGSNDQTLKAGFFRMDSSDLMRFGQLYLNKGNFNDIQILDPMWIAESTQAVSHTDLGNGYGYMWWTSANGISIPGMNAFHSSLYYAWGWGGHYLVIIPSYKLVVVHRTDTNNVKQTIHVSHEQFASILDEIIACYV